MSASIKIVTKDQILKNEKFTIFLRVIINRKSKYYSTPFQVYKKDWNESQGQFKNKFPNANVLNTALNKIKQTAINIIAELEIEYGVYNIILFDQKYRKTEFKKYTFEELLLKEISTKTTNKQINYAKTLKDTHAALLKFQPKLKQYSFENIDYHFLQEFENFLRKRGAGDGGIGVYMRNIRMIYNQAINYKIIQQQFYPFRDYKISKLKKKDIRKALTTEEIEILVNYDIDKIPSAKNALYAYILSYYARGMNFTDLAELKWNQIENNKFAYHRNKTDVLIKVSLPTNRTIKRIFDYFATYNPFATPYVLPILTKDIKEYSPEELIDRKNSVRSYYNKELKKILKDCDIEKNITFYTARHTYATNALRGKLNINLIKQSLGHKRLSTTENYLEDFSDDEMHNAVNSIF